MKIKLEKGAYMPERAHETDAGLDLRTPGYFEMYPGEMRVIDTGVHIEIPHGYFGKIESKSGLYTKYGITTCGVIDEGYTGSIKVALQMPVILSNENDKNDLKRITCAEFFEGDKIAQIIIQPCIKPELELVSRLPKTERGNNGFGSSGR